MTDKIDPTSLAAAKIVQKYYCCATCQHFTIEKRGHKNVTRCARLTYETQPNYQFKCWDPKQRVREKMLQKINQLDDQGGD